MLLKVHMGDPRRHQFKNGGDVVATFCKNVVWRRDTSQDIKRVTCQNCVKQALKCGTGS